MDLQTLLNKNKLARERKEKEAEEKRLQEEAQKAAEKKVKKSQKKKVELEEKTEEDTIAHKPEQRLYMVTEDIETVNNVEEE